MTIHAFCLTCKSTFAQGMKSCPRCETPVPRTGRKFRVRVTVNGRTVSRLAPNLEIARKIDKTIGGELVQGEYVDRRKKIKAPRLIDVWTRYKRENAREVKGLRADADRFARHLEPRFGKWTLDRITAKEIESYRADLSKAKNRWNRNFSDASIWNILELLRRVIRYALGLGLYYGDDPFKAVRFPRKNNVVDQPLNAEQFRRLVDAADNFKADPGFGALVRFIAFTACRRSEALTLRWDDVNMDEGRATLRDTKAGKAQTLTLNKGALVALRAQEPRTKATGKLIFPTERGKMRSNTNFYWMKLKESADLPARFRLHDLRHTAATLLAASGKATLEDVRGLLRHADERTARRYTHYLPGHLRKVSGILDDIAGDTPADEKITDLDAERRRRKA